MPWGIRHEITTKAAKEGDMSNHAENLHLDGAAIGGALISAIMANDAVRKQAAIEAEAEANSVASVRALGRELAASMSREAALKAEVVRLQFELGRAQGALRRGQAHRQAGC